MKLLSEEKIQEIAEQLECGFICYVHKNNHEIIPIPDFANDGIDKTFWKEDVQKIKALFKLIYDTLSG